MRSLVCVCACSLAGQPYFPGVRMLMRKWAEGGKEKRLGRRSRFLWQRGICGMSSTCTK